MVYHKETLGLSIVHEQLVDALRALGLGVFTAAVSGGKASVLKVGYPLIDLVEGASLRHATERSLDRVSPRATIFETPSALLFEPLGRLASSAVRFDAPAALNRPGFRNRWQRARQGCALERAKLLLPATTGAHQWAQEHLPRSRSVPLFSPILTSAPAAQPRRRAVTFYAANPEKKGLDVAVRAWHAAALRDYVLEVIGITEQTGQRFLSSRGLAAPRELRWLGTVSHDEYRRLTRAAAIHLATPRFDEYAAAQLEALSDGALLVTGVPRRGPFEPLQLARQLAPNLVAPSLQAAEIGRRLRVAAGMSELERVAYRRRADHLLRPYRLKAFRRSLAADVVPLLLDNPS